MAKVLNVLSLIKPDFTTEQEPDYAKLTRDEEVAKSLAADPLRHDRMTVGLWREIIKAQNWVINVRRYPLKPLGALTVPQNLILHQNEYRGS